MTKKQNHDHECTPPVFYPEILKPYERRRVSIKFLPGTSRTKQSFKDECNINTIMLRYQKTEIIEHYNKHMGKYGDFTNTPSDYQSCIDQVMEAEGLFMELPSSVRKTFQNDPGQFLAFVSDPNNLEAMVDMGLAKAPPAAPSPATLQTSSGEVPKGPTGTEAA